ncbi:MAG TPA: DUF5666 domain-containing protein [Acidimicrobiales bacterium]
MKHPTSHMRRSVLATAAGISLGASLAVAGVAGAATPPSGGGAFPFTSGSVAALSGSTMEVQNPQSGQVTVSWTPSTTFTQTATVSASSVAAGDCVTVTGSSSKGTITAKTVSISQPTSGKCAAGSGGGGFRGGFGGGPGGGGTPPGGTSAGRPGGRAGGFPGNGRGFGGSGSTGFASGKVTSVASGKLTISGISSASISRNAKPSSNSSNKRSTLKTTTFNVAVTASTTYAEDQAAAASNLAVGDCITAGGTTSSTGAVSATSVRITSTGGQTCTTGFGRRGIGG